MVAVAEAFCEAGYCVLRWDLPFRQARPRGAPGGSGERDREGIRQAAQELRQLATGVPLYLAGQSYGGRQSSMVAAEDPNVADGLLLLSYPLHPPGKPAQLRTEHFGLLRTPALFVHGTRDPFGSVDELREAIKLIPGACAARKSSKARATECRRPPPHPCLDGFLHELSLRNASSRSSIAFRPPPNAPDERATRSHWSRSPRNSPPR